MSVIRVYEFDENSFFICENIAQVCPKTNEVLMPPMSTIIEPPILEENQKAVFDGANWEIIQNEENVDTDNSIYDLPDGQGSYDG